MCGPPDLRRNEFEYPQGLPVCPKNSGTFEAPRASSHLKVVALVLTACGRAFNLPIMSFESTNTVVGTDPSRLIQTLRLFGLNIAI